MWADIRAHFNDGISAIFGWWSRMSYIPELSSEDGDEGVWLVVVGYNANWILSSLLELNNHLRYMYRVSRLIQRLDYQGYLNGVVLCGGGSSLPGGRPEWTQASSAKSVLTEDYPISHWIPVLLEERGIYPHESILYGLEGVLDYMLERKSRLEVRVILVSDWHCTYRHYRLSHTLISWINHRFHRKAIKLRGSWSIKRSDNRIALNFIVQAGIHLCSILNTHKLRRWFNRQWEESRCDNRYSTPYSS